MQGDNNDILYKACLFWHFLKFEPVTLNFGHNLYYVSSYPNTAQWFSEKLASGNIFRFTFLVYVKITYVVHPYMLRAKENVDHS